MKEINRRARIEYDQLCLKHGAENIVWTTFGCTKPTEEDEPRFNANYYKFDVKRRTGRFPAVDLPLPETEAPEEGAAFYYLSHATKYGYYISSWMIQQFHSVLLKNGAVYLREEDIKQVVAHNRVCPIDYKVVEGSDE